MRLKLDTVQKSLQRFVKCYGAPQHIDSLQKSNEIIAIYHDELSKHFTEETFRSAESLAWTKTRKFPTVSDFFEGYGGKQKQEVDISGYRP